jgi:DNA topoisomerase-1
MPRKLLSNEPTNTGLPDTGLPDTAAPTNKLVIVESPSKCKKIESFLNNNSNSYGITYKCLASCGHIRELNGIASIDIKNNFALSFINSESKKEQINKLKQAIKSADEVILATDDDREGEAIAWHICQVFGLPVEKTPRIIFHEITESALQRAIKTPTTVNMQIVNAQLARQTLDTLVGYKLSPLLWKYVKDGISAGRCQTPALRLIYENQKEIDKSPGKQYYSIVGSFTNKNILFVLNHEETDEINVSRFLTESKSFNHLYGGYELKEKESAAPKAFTTSTLQQASSNKFHTSPKETMALCQKLYESGSITYPRTDSTTYSEEFREKMVDYINNRYGKEYVNDKASDDKASEDKASEDKVPSKPTKPAKTSKSGKQAKPTIEKPNENECPHEAIRPTDITVEELDETHFTGKENRLYRLIRERTLESCMKDTKISLLTCSVNAPMNYIYKYQTEHIVFAGWKIVGGYENINKEYNYLQLLKPSVVLNYNKIKATIHLKETKQHYTEAKLIQLLEEKGIGRPSTFSSLIDKIQERKYVKKENVKGRTIVCREFELEEQVIKSVNSEREFGNEKNKLVITPVGILTLEFLLKHFDTLFQYSYTKQMEDALDEVAKNNAKWQDVCEKCNIEIENLSSTILERGKEIIQIDEQHTYMIGKYGPVIKCDTNNVTNATNATTTDKPNSKKSKDTSKKDTNVTFKAVRKDIDLNKLRNGEYTIDELVESPEDKEIQLQLSSIGNYKDLPVYVKTGKFGKYLEWNDMKTSLKHIKIKMETITLDDVIEDLYDLETKQDEPSILRAITDDASIRKGKYGDYIYYKNKKMKKPKFLKIEGFNKIHPPSQTFTYLTCDISVLQEWFNKAYIDT